MPDELSRFADVLEGLNRNDPSRCSYCQLYHRQGHLEHTHLHKSKIFSKNAGLWVDDLLPDELLQVTHIERSGHRDVESARVAIDDKTCMDDCARTRDRLDVWDESYGPKRGAAPMGDYWYSVNDQGRPLCRCLSDCKEE